MIVEEDGVRCLVHLRVCLSPLRETITLWQSRSRVRPARRSKRHSKQRDQSFESDVLRGAGGRAALERYADRVDALLRQLFAEAARSDGRGRRHRARRLRPAPPVSPLGHRPARAVRRPHRRRRRSASSRAFLQPALGSRRRGRPPGARARRLRAVSRPTTRSSCWRCSTRGRLPASASLFDRFARAVSHRRDARVHPEVAAAS